MIYIIRLLVLPFKAEENDPRRNSFDKYYMSLVEIKYFNALTENKPFFDQPVKNHNKLMKNLSNFQEKIITEQGTY